MDPMLYFCCRKGWRFPSRPPVPSSSSQHPAGRGCVSPLSAPTGTLVRFCIISLSLFACFLVSYFTSVLEGHRSAGFQRIRTILDAPGRRIYLPLMSTNPPISSIVTTVCFHRNTNKKANFLGSCFLVEERAPSSSLTGVHNSDGRMELAEHVTPFFPRFSGTVGG